MAVAAGLVRLQWRGVTVTKRMLQALRWVEANSGVPIDPAQGSYNAGGVSASSGTHDREAIDIRVRGLSQNDIDTLVRWLRKAGFAAWQRREAPGVWGPHVHAVPCSGDLSVGAAQQVRDYDRGLDGLAGRRPDPTWRPKIKRRWSYRLGKPVPRV